MNRRDFSILTMTSAGLALQPTFAQTPPSIVALLRKGGCALMLRHAQTEPGIGDPPGFQLEQCSTQRNLSPAGREQARRVGQWFKANKLRPRSVQTSPWCRCKDTAELAFGHYTVLESLASTFDNRAAEDGQGRELRTRLQFLPAGQFEVWVTHQVNITALAGTVVAMGEAVLLDSKARQLDRTLFSN